MFFQQYFKELREKQGLTQKEFASALGISLPTIKKIEGGFTKMPSPKLIEVLSDYLKTEPRKIIRDILFFDESIYSINTCKFLQLFLSQMYVDGWNIKVGPIYTDSYVGKRVYPAFVSTRSGTLIKGIVDMPSLYNFYDQLEKDEQQVQAFITNRLLEISQLEDLPIIKQVLFVFDADKEKDVEVFNLINRLPVKYFKIDILIFLYDSNNNIIVKEKIFQ